MTNRKKLSNMRTAIQKEIRAIKYIRKERQRNYNGKPPMIPEWIFLQKLKTLHRILKAGE